MEGMEGQGFIYKKKLGRMRRKMKDVMCKNGNLGKRNCESTLAPTDSNRPQKQPREKKTRSSRPSLTVTFAFPLVSFHSARISRWLSYLQQNEGPARHALSAPFRYSSFYTVAVAITVVAEAGVSSNFLIFLMRFHSPAA